MDLLIGLLINLLILALIICVLFWVLGMIASALELPPKIIAIVKCIVALICLLWIIEILLGGAVGFYPVHLHH